MNKFIRIFIAFVALILSTFFVSFSPSVNAASNYPDITKYGWSAEVVSEKDNSVLYSTTQSSSKAKSNFDKYKDAWSDAGYTVVYLALDETPSETPNADTYGVYDDDYNVIGVLVYDPDSKCAGVMLQDGSHLSNAKKAAKKASASAGSSKSSSGKLPAPSNISYTSDSTSITLKWNAVSGADAYKVYKYNSSPTASTYRQNP